MGLKKTMYSSTQRHHRVNPQMGSSTRPIADFGDVSIQTKWFNMRSLPARAVRGLHLCLARQPINIMRWRAMKMVGAEAQHRVWGQTTLSWSVELRQMLLITIISRLSSRLTTSMGAVVVPMVLNRSLSRSAIQTARVTLWINSGTINVTGVAPTLATRVEHSWTTMAGWAVSPRIIKGTTIPIQRVVSIMRTIPHSLQLYKSQTQKKKVWTLPSCKT